MKILVTRNIPRDTASVWQILSDYSNIHRFHPLLKTSGFIEGSCTTEPGATRQCDMLDGSFLKERVTEWKEGSHYSVEVYETSMPVRESTATIGVTKLDDQSSMAYMQIKMKSRYALLAPMLYLIFRYYAGPAILRGLSKATQKEVQSPAFKLQTAS
jgi:hypothetical protein